LQPAPAQPPGGDTGVAAKAVLDSGIAWQHRDFTDDVTGTSRVRPPPPSDRAELLTTTKSAR
jgi:hypothetical protein